MGKKDKTAEFDAVEVVEAVESFETSSTVSEFIPTSVNECLSLIMELGAGNSFKLTPKQKSALLSILRPYRGKDRNGDYTNYVNIAGGINDETLDGIKFTLTVPIPITNKKGKIVETKNELLQFSVRNIVKNVTRFASGKIAEFSSLSISAYYRADTLIATEITF